MSAVFDASALVFLFDANASGPVDEATGSPLSGCQLRLHHFITQLQASKTQIIIPAPALAEILTFAADAASEWLSILNRSRHIRIAPFDQLAAVECAALAHDRRQRGGQLTGVQKRKAKFDEQIVAIARVERASIILSDDDDIRRLSGDRIPVLRLADLDLPPEDRQTSFLDTLDPA